MENFKLRPYQEEAIEAVKAAGFGFVVNNRPDGEAFDQPEGAEMEAAAQGAGLGYCAIPIDHSGFSVEQVAALSALMVSPRPILAYCRSGTRSVTAWALGSLRAGDHDREALVALAAGAGYDLSAVLPRPM
jgi:uncharacterized protein (TIGR01244 family)